MTSSTSRRLRRRGGDRPASALCRAGESRRRYVPGFAQERIPLTIASICLSVSMPPALFAKAGIGVPGTPLATVRRIAASSAIARKTGLPREIAAPPLPSWPWHPAQFSRVENVEVHYLAGRDHLRVRAGPPGRMAAARLQTMADDGQCKNGTVLHHRWLLSVPLVHGAGRFHAGANGEGKMLPGAHPLLPRDDDARDNAESHLGDDKPGPVDPLVEHGIHEFQNAMDQTSPQDGRDHTTQQNRAARKHRKHCAIEQPDQKRSDEWMMTAMIR